MAADPVLVLVNCKVPSEVTKNTTPDAMFSLKSSNRLTEDDVPLIFNLPDLLEVLLSKIYSIITCPSRCMSNCKFALVRESVMFPLLD